MSDPETKEKHSMRIHKKHVKAHHNSDVARTLGVDVKPWEEHRFEDDTHLNDNHGGNPRKSQKEKTKQEKSFEQTEPWNE
jgi:hypothetical protein